jgi:hypothetical protein
LRRLTGSFSDRSFSVQFFAKARLAHPVKLVFRCTGAGESRRSTVPPRT